MTSKVKYKLCLSQDGLRVKVIGPFITWDQFEETAVFSVTISQPDATGIPVDAAGSSRPGEIYRPPANRWDATAVVVEPGKSLHHGPATAVATATINVDDPAPKPYTWTVDVKLVACAHFV
jgi:hypothetical protein